MGEYVGKRPRKGEARVVDIVERLSPVTVVVVALFWGLLKVNHSYVFGGHCREDITRATTYLFVSLSRSNVPQHYRCRAAGWRIRFFSVQICDEASTR